MGAPNQEVVATDMSEFEDLMDRVIHSYPRDPRYRLSGAPMPQVGDVARCGHVKVDPRHFVGAPLTCAGCATLRAMQ